MKTVFADKQDTAHAWAQRNQSTGREGSRGRIFFEGDTIYSYGRHFPIAAFFDRKKRGKEKETVCFLTTRSYSPTTSAHIHAAYSAASHYRVIRCQSPTDAIRGSHADNMANFESRAHKIAIKLTKAIKPEKYIDQIAGIRAEAKVYSEFFGLNLKSKKFGMKYIFVESKDGGKKATAKEIADIAKHKKEQAARRAKALAKAIEDFRSGESEYLYHIASDYTLLRVNEMKNGIETSKHIFIPYDSAKLAFDTLKKLQAESLKASDDFRGRGIQIFGFPLIRLDSIQFEVGCHKITFAELDAVAVAMGWNQVYEMKGA